jgi:hypothetical protein
MAKIVVAPLHAAKALHSHLVTQIRHKFEISETARLDSPK